MKLADGMRDPDFTVDQPDGAVWAVYEDPTDIRRYSILTSSGQEQFHGDGLGPLRSLIHQYRAAEVGSIALLGESPGIRKELGRGQEAIVYAMGPYAVREEPGIKGVYAALGELERMDAINGIIEGGTPRWLNLPKHYALHSDPERLKTYTLMDRVNGGLTAADIIDYPEIEPHRAALVEAELGGDAGIEEAKARVPVLYDRAHVILSDAITEAGKIPDHYLTDWKPRNVIVERFKTPIANEKYNLNVIDQYRA